jgi:hypothetical protein
MMRRSSISVTYKLPAQFVDAHRAALDAVDWSATPVTEIDLGWPQNPVLEVTSRHGITIVRPATIKSANLIRRSVDAEPVDPDAVSAALSSRNPPIDIDQEG